MSVEWHWYHRPGEDEHPIVVHGNLPVDRMYAVVDEQMLKALSGKKLSVEWVAEDTYYDTLKHDLSNEHLLFRERAFLTKDGTKVLSVEYELHTLVDVASHLYHVCNDVGVIQSTLARMGIQWDRTSPISAGLWPEIGMVTNRVVVNGYPGFHMDVCGITAGHRFGRMCAIACFADTTIIPDLLGPNGCARYSRPLLDLILHGEFNDDVVGALGCPGILTPHDLPDNEDD